MGPTFGSGACGGQGSRQSRDPFVGQPNTAVPGFRDAEFRERVTEILVTSGVGVPTTAKLTAKLEQETPEKIITSAEELRKLMIEPAARLLEKPVELSVLAHEHRQILGAPLHEAPLSVDATAGQYP